MYVCIWVRYMFGRNYDFLCMIMDNLTMNLLRYPANGGYSLVFWYLVNGDYSLVLWYPVNGGYSLVLWYLANGDYSLVFWYPNQWGLFIGTLIPKPMGVIHWYSDTQSRGYSLTIVISLLRIWITFEPWTILST